MKFSERKQKEHSKKSTFLIALEATHTLNEATQSRQAG
jgi:hypothetical protein